MADPMNLSDANPGLTPQIWDDQFFAEYIRENQFMPLMGDDESAVIQLKDDLNRRPGDRVTFAFVNRLVGAGVRGHQVLRGNEEILNDRSMMVVINPIRHAVAIDQWTAQKSAIDKRQAAKVGLKNWETELLRQDVINSLVSVAPNVTFGAATGAQQTAWLGNNSDRALFGNLRANTALGSASTSLGNVNSNTGRMGRATLELAKRMARAAHPRIQPYRTKTGVDIFVVYMDPLAFRDLRNDPGMRTDLQMAMERGKDNPIFTGGDLYVDGMIVKEEPEFEGVRLYGAGGTYGGGAATDVGMTVLLGAQAIGCAWAQRPVTVEDTYDYGFENGVGIQEIRGIDKLRFGKGANDQDNPVDHGVFTIFSSVPADA